MSLSIHATSLEPRTSEPEPRTLEPPNAGLRQRPTYPRAPQPQPPQRTKSALGTFSLVPAIVLSGNKELRGTLGCSAPLHRARPSGTNRQLGGGWLLIHPLIHRPSALSLSRSPESRPAHFSRAHSFPMAPTKVKITYYDTAMIVLDFNDGGLRLLTDPVLDPRTSRVVVVPLRAGARSLPIRILTRARSQWVRCSSILVP